MRWITAVRWIPTQEIIYLKENTRKQTYPPHQLEGDTLCVYVGTFDEDLDNQEVVIATIDFNVEDAENEILECVFCGPAADAWALFHAHAEMLP